MSYNYDSSSYQRPYSNQGSSAWPMGIEPFSRPQQNLSPMQDFGYGQGYNNNGRPLLPSPNDGGRGGIQFDYGHGSQRPTVMPMSNGPSRDDLYMSDMGRSSDNYRGDNWGDRYDDGGRAPSMQWKGSSNSMNGQGSQYSNQQSYQPSFTSSYSDRPIRTEDNRSRRSYQEPVRSSRSFRAGTSDSTIRRTVKPVPNRYANTTDYKWKSVKPAASKVVPAPPNKKGPYFCKVCNLKFVPYSALIAHNKTSDHNRQKQLHENMLRKMAAAKEAGLDPEAVKLALAEKKTAKPKKEALSYCTICKTKFSGSSIEHLASDKHKLHKAMDRPYCGQCQRFFRTPTLFVRHCNSDVHKKKGQVGNKEGDSAIDAEFFTLDAVGCYDSEQGPAKGKPKKKKKMTSLNKITISLPAGNVSQGAAAAASGDIPVVSITQENGVETKSVSMKKAGEAKATEEESSDEDVTDGKPVGLAFVVPITGFYCQICEQFFKDENIARNDHCISKAHRKKYKAATVEDAAEDAPAEDAKIEDKKVEVKAEVVKVEDSTANGENGAEASQKA